MTVGRTELRLDPLDPLDEVLAALFRGDWRTATLTLRDHVDASTHPALVTIVFCLRCVAHSMRLQSVLAEVEAAWHHLDTAATRLRDIPAAELQSPRVDQLHPRVTLLIEREIADLHALRAAVEYLHKGTDELVYACLEYMTFVEFDPFTVALHPEDSELTGLTPARLRQWRRGNRTDTVARATKLRYFSTNHEKLVSERTWSRLDSYPGLRKAALLTLAAEPVSRGRTDLDIDDVRLGRRRAWEYACQFRDDLIA